MLITIKRYFRIYTITRISIKENFTRTALFIVYVNKKHLYIIQLIFILFKKKKNDLYTAYL